MSRAPSFPPPSQGPQTWSWKIPSFSVSQPGSSSSSVKKVSSAETSRPSPNPAQSGSNLQARTPSRPPPVPDVVKRAKRRRLLTNEEEAIKSRISSTIALTLESDRIQVLYPDVDSPFEDEFDVVNRLLPYHILQQPKVDLDEIIDPKRPSNISHDVQDTKFAIDCHRRLSKLQRRFRKTRIASGKHSSPSSQSVCLERLIRESDKQETSSLDQALSAARAELDRLQKSHLLATMKTNKPPTPAPAPPTAPPTSTPTSNYSNHTFSVTPTPATYSQFYNSYMYTYGQSGVTSYSGASVPTFSIQTPSTSSAPVAKPPPPPVPSRPSVSHSTPNPPASVAIPLQVPITLLPALQAIGILPVPKASLPPPSEPQPAAVLIGATNNGTMLSLEINAALLQGPQMSGLAVLLSDLVKTSGNASASANGTSGKSTVSEPQSGASSNANPNANGP